MLGHAPGLTRPAVGTPLISQDSARETIRGLSEADALARRARGQGNSASLRTGRTYLQILRGNVLTFINGVLFGLGVALVLLGRWSDALVSVGVVAVNVLVSVVQEVRAKRMLDRIALLTRPTATVLRDGQERSIDPAEVVLGDVLALTPGDQVVVDAVVLGGGRTDMDESLLTGESDLVSRSQAMSCTPAAAASAARRCTKQHGLAPRASPVGSPLVRGRSRASRPLGAAARRAAARTPAAATTGL